MSKKPYGAERKREKKEYTGWNAVIRDPRVIIVAILVVLSLCAIFAPITDRGDSLTNLQFGLDLEGGSWIQLEFQSKVVTVDDFANIYDVAKGMSDALDCTVNVIDQNKLEVQKIVSDEELRSAVESSGAKFVSSETGVGAETADSVKRILESKVNSLGTNDVKINILTNINGVAQYVRVEMAGVDMQTAQEIVGSQGLFEVRIVTNANNTEHVLYGDSVVAVQTPSRDMHGAWGVGFTLNDEGANLLRDACIKYGAVTSPNAHDLQMYLDGELVYTAPLSPELAVSIAKTPVYSLSASTGVGDDAKQRAQELEVHLRAGALPVQVQIAGSGSTSAALGDYFKVVCVIAALAALAAVAIVVYLRYRVAKIVLPMIATNIAEIVILLGIAVFIQQLDIAAIAALIAVLGTGIDQLVIITDEVIHEGIVPSKALYLKRLKRALAIIITSAATVVISLVPLVVMDLSTLRGFAIISILGVLIGVVITRPAYGRVIMEIVSKNK